jgi:hypothetical protein
MTLAIEKELMRTKIKARLATLKKLCSQAHNGDIYMVLEGATIASISWCISKFETSCEKFCLIHYRTGDGDYINTAESQARMTERIADGEYCGGSYFSKVLDAYLAGDITISHIPPLKEQPG